MTVMMYIQSGTVNAEDPADILAPLSGKVDAITTYESGNAAAVDALFDAAQAAGYETYIWLSPGLVYSGMSSSYNLANVIDGYPSNWAALHLEACRADVLSHWTAIAQDYVDAGNLTGILLDYCRYQNCDPYTYEELSSDDITSVLTDFRTWASARSLKTIVTVQRGQNTTCGEETVASYLSRGQDWPAWLTSNLADSVQVMSYSLNYYGNPSSYWNNQPTDSRLAKTEIILDPGGTESGTNPAPTEEEWDEEVGWVKAYNHPYPPSLFDWGNINDEDAWDYVDPIANWFAEAHLVISGTIYVSGVLHIN